ncbi:MAG: hypothetical protein M3133_02850 [Actinomycetota bacterium]|nr:hypothetical protein [Actinomycetota bacterium]
MRPIAALSAACALLVAGCGGDEDDERSHGEPVTFRAGEPVRVVGGEYFFRPADVVVSGARGETGVRFLLVNEGALAHNLKVFADGRELGGTPTFPGGETRSGTVRLRPGNYRLVCTVGDHAELGMTGRLVVR